MREGERRRDVGKKEAEEEEEEEAFSPYCHAERLTHIFLFFCPAIVWAK